MANPIPEGFRAITPHLIVDGAGEAIDFYTKAFGAKEVMRMPGPDGKSVMHAELDINDSRIMIADQYPDMGTQGPKTIGGTPVCIHFYCDDVDGMVKQATEAGAELLMPPMDMFWGDRYGKVKDPFGHEWSVATHTKDMTPQEIGVAADEFMKNMGGCES